MLANVIAESTDADCSFSRVEWSSSEYCQLLFRLFPSFLPVMFAPKGESIKKRST